MKPYEILEHTADVGLKASGSTLKELFENAARGMFEIIAGEKIHQPFSEPASRKVEIKKEVKDLEELLVDWLSELLYIFNKEGILLGHFKVFELNYSGITGEAYGEKVDPERHTLQTEIKAVTFHRLKIEEDKKGFSCNIIFDV